MENVVPMDRLICGDVGYGKTEIAVRAAFKAVQDGKQVAVLVPDHAARAAAPVDLLRAVRGVPGEGRGAVAVPDRQGGQGGHRGHRRRHGRRRHRHAPAAQRRGAVQGPRPGDRRRGAALRRRAQGAPQGAAHQRRRARRCRRRRSRARWRWRSPASARCRRSRRRRRSGTRCSRSSGRTTTSRSRPRSAASCCARARSSSCTTGSSRSTGSPPSSRELVPEARIAVAHGQMNEHALEQVIVDFWEKEFDVLVCTTIVEIGHRHRQREHADRRPRRHVRPVPAAPAARPGRPRPRARVRLLPLPAGEAAHRDGARPARHDRASTPTSGPACPSR